MSVDRIISVESGGNPNARNPRSTATGPGQFIDATWLSMMQKYRPDLIQNMGRDQILAMRTNPELSREMTANYANENKEMLGKAGLPVTDGTAYLAHFAGPQGAMKVLQADPTAMAGDILGPAVVKANPFLANMTAGDLADWADKKMGVQPTTPVAPAAPQGILAQPQQAPGGLAPPPQMPGGIMAPQTTSQPASAPPDDMTAFLAPPKPLQHLQIPMARPRAGLSFRG